MKDKIYITLLILLLVGGVAQYVLYERDKAEMLANQEEATEKIKEEAEARIDEILIEVEAEKNKHNTKINNLLDRNRNLNAIIWDYENNPAFDDFDLLERARHIANYQYKPSDTVQ